MKGYFCTRVRLNSGKVADRFYKAHGPKDAIRKADSRLDVVSVEDTIQITESAYLIGLQTSDQSTPFRVDNAVWNNQHTKP